MIPRRAVLSNDHVRVSVSADVSLVSDIWALHFALMMLANNRYSAQALVLLH